MKPFFYSHETNYYHLSGKCIGQAWPDTDIGQVWYLCQDILNDFYEGYRLQTHAFVLMRNHFHWLCSFQGEHKNPEEVFAWFQEAFQFDYRHSFQMMHMLETSYFPELFDENFNITKIDHIESYKNTYAYIYRNPVSAGIVDEATQYPYSTLPYILGRTDETFEFPLFDNMGLIENTASILSFIARGNTQIRTQLGGF